MSPVFTALAVALAISLAGNAGFAWAWLSDIGHAYAVALGLRIREGGVR